MTDVEINEGEFKIMMIKLLEALMEKSRQQKTTYG